MLLNIFIVVLNMSISGALAAALLMLWRLAAKRFVPPGYFYMLWAALLLRLLVPFSPKSPLSLINLIRGADDLTHGGSYALTIEYLQQSDIAAALPGQGSAVLPALAWVWLAVAVLLWLLWVASHIVTARCFRYAVVLKDPAVQGVREKLGIKKPLPVYVSGNLLSPVVTGLLSPRIILPKQRSPETMPYAIAHEMVHARRRDPLLKAIFFFVAALHWFNPLVWLSFICFDHDVESSCDQKVLAAYGMENKRAYAEALVYYAERSNPALVGPTAFSGSKIRERVEKVLEYRPLHPMKTVVFAAVTLLIGVCAVTNPVLQDDYAYIPKTVYLPAGERRVIDEFVDDFVAGLSHGDAESIAAMATADPGYFAPLYSSFEGAGVELSVKKLFYTSAASADAHLTVHSDPKGVLPRGSRELVLRVGSSDIDGSLTASWLHPLGRYNAIGAVDPDDEAVLIVQRLIKYGIKQVDDTPQCAEAIAAFCMDMACHRSGGRAQIIPAAELESIAAEFFLLQDFSRLRATRFFDPASDAYIFDGSIGTYFEYQILSVQKTETNATVTVEYYLDPLQTQTESVVKYTLERV